MSTIRRRNKKSDKRFLIPLMYVLAVLLLCGAGYLVSRNYIGFHSQADKYEAFVHKMGEASFVPPADIWSEKNLSRYQDKGVGIEPISFVKILPNGKKVERKFELERWAKYQEEGDNPKRRALVRKAKEHFDEMLAWLNKPEQLHRNILTFVDTSGAISTQDSRLISDRLEEYSLIESVQNGDSVKFRGCWIASSRFENCIPTLTIQPGETAMAKELEKVIRKMAEEKPDSPSTSLYEGFANVLIPLAENGNLPEELPIFTDGVENDPSTLKVSFYSKEFRKLLAPVKGDDESQSQRRKNFEEVKKKVESRKALPDMKGVAVVLYGPRRGEGTEREVIDNSLDFAVWLFQQHGANARKFYE